MPFKSQYKDTDADADAVTQPFLPVADHPLTDPETTYPKRPTTTSSSHITLHKHTFTLFLLLTLLNLILCASNTYYSALLTRTLAHYERKDLESLPHVDAFTGDFAGFEWKSSSRS